MDKPSDICAVGRSQVICERLPGGFRRQGGAILNDVGLGVRAWPRQDRVGRLNRDFKPFNGEGVNGRGERQRNCPYNCMSDGFYKFYLF